MALLIERDFQMTWEHSDYDRLFAPALQRVVPDLTAGEVHRSICARLRELERPVPPSSWHRVQRILAQITRTSPKRIHLQSYLKKDLGFCA